MLAISNASKSFGSKKVLHDLSLNVEKGSIFGFCGANGQGKTTAMRIMIGILKPDSGTVRWNGASIGRKELRRIGYMPEERGLYPKMTPKRQLAYFGVLSGVNRREAEERAEYWLERLAVKLNPNDSLENLSLGNQQRVQLASTLLHEPDLLVLDEPFSGLDPVAVNALSELLVEQARKGVSIVLSSHQLELVENLCDSVGVLKDGRLVAEGPVSEIKKQSIKRIAKVKLSGASDSWHVDLPGTRLVERGEISSLHVDEGIPPEELLKNLMERGTVEHFSWNHQNLSEVFLDLAGVES
ncbi:ABC transporter ATP-binding protein [Nocardiopsis sp. CC223A]|uniref:ABC transporter ATP-binding protein n=1 Tax=Nocardiopsis sp. CC223A TaxID=3044051 RepID=UPI00278BC39A|nr:ATP-binding cassette domain-containing protein [Nocardiopsis sp. CC223A]